jgi:hypothetical protein
MDKVYQVFVSSTYSDLQNERKHVSETLAKAGYIPAGMELFPATDMQQFEFIKRIIDRSDYYVVIVAGKYGSVADDGMSFTEKEYEYAVSKRIPVLAFLHEDPTKIEVGKTDQDLEKSKKLQAFRDRLKTGRLVDFWSDHKDLGAKVVIAVANSANLAPGVGWVRGDQAIDPRVLQDFERLRKENEDLKKIIALKDVVSERDQKRQQLLDEIASLRNQMVNLRIEMEKDIVRPQRRCSDAEWNRKLDALQQAIATKIEQFSSKAEADTYSSRGNIPRQINTNMGGYVRPIFLDVCIYDLDYLKQFIHDYSRQKQRP